LVAEGRRDRTIWARRPRSEEELRTSHPAQIVRALRWDAMTRRSLGLNDELQQYVVEHSAAPDKLQLALIEETAALGRPAGMQIGSEQGQLLTMITQMVGARFAVEVGTFTGYSSICIARGLSPRGKLLCCDVSEEWTAIARRYWKSAGLDKRIELRL